MSDTDTEPVSLNLGPVCYTTQQSRKTCLCDVCKQQRAVEHWTRNLSTIIEERFTLEQEETQLSTGQAARLAMLKVGHPALVNRVNAETEKLRGLVEKERDQLKAKKAKEGEEGAGA